MSTPAPPEPGQARKRARVADVGKRWRHVRAISKFIKLSIDVNRMPKETVPTDDELYTLALAEFRKYDKDKNGSLDYDEFRTMLLDLGVQHANLHQNVVQQYILTVDLNRDHVISFDEFLICYKSLLLWDRDRFTLRAPLNISSAEASDSPQPMPHRPKPKEPSPLDNCPRTNAPPVVIGDVEFVVSERYQLGALLGKGAYGVIAAAQDTLTGDRVVVKRIAAVGHPIELQATLRELLILRHLRRHPHDNLLSLLDITPPPVGTLDAWRALFLVLPRMDCDLHAVIRSNQPLSNEHCQFFSYQLLRGLIALHSCNVVHRDLKPSNLLVNRDCTLRIADFGISRALGSNESTMSAVAEREGAEPPPGPLLTNYIVTRYYRSPELLLEAKSYGFGVDVWSAACIVAEMILRRPLWCGTSSAHQLALIAHYLGPPTDAECADLLRKHRSSNEKVALLTTAPRGVDPAEWLARRSNVAEVLTADSTLGGAHAGSVELVEAMLRYSPADRLTVSRALEHPWLSELHECNEEPRLPPIVMPSCTGRGISRKSLQLAAIESIRELHALHAPHNNARAKHQA
jgi:serine/threonine protein kinase